MRRSPTLVLALGICACSPTKAADAPPASSTTDAAPPAVVDDATAPSLSDADTDVPGTDLALTVFDKAHVYFAGADNKRQLDAEVTFPESGTYASVTLSLELGCPNGKCDFWDRFGSLGIVTAVGLDQGKDQLIELVRFMTPYRVGATWEFDVTDLQPLLRGKRTFRVFIDTWVGPGNASGDGWLVTAKVTTKGGVPDKVPIFVMPVWNGVDAVYGDPDNPIGKSVAPAALTLPKAASSLAVRAFVTGHGQGNAGNCAEFCARNHTLTIGKQSDKKWLWRNDCATTAVPNQSGNWQPSRAGWCPGADVKPWVVAVDAGVGADVLSGKTALPIAYSVDDYTNTCRPGAVPDGGTCSGCYFGDGCEYNDSSHTVPVFKVSAMLIGYR